MSSRFVLALATLWVSLAHADTEQIVVTRANGEVTITAHGLNVDTRAGSKLTPPVTIKTGVDGSARLEQSSATLDIGPNSIVELRETVSKATVLQRGGRVMYTVRPRKTRDFSVATPYLVAVVKGTVFTVAVAEDAAQVTLVEGSVELQGEGLSESVLLQPNQTGKRGAGERSISVTTIDTTPPAQANLDRSRSTALNDTTTAPARFTELTTANDLNEIAATRGAEQRGRGPATPPAGDQPNTDTAPSGTPPPTTPPPTTPTSPSIPIPPPTQTPAPELPPTPGTPAIPVTPPITPTPELTPIPPDDDGNNGGGNDRDGDDDSNPGRGRGKNRDR